MAGQQTVIYAARTLQDAHLLKNLLTEAGIRASVTNDVLQGGSGVDVVGWRTLARVVVAEEDAESARSFVRDFEQRGLRLQAAGADIAPPSEAPPEELAGWPLCPECDKPRLAVCPICQTAGTELPRADPEFVGSLGLDDTGQGETCGCGSGGCCPGKGVPQEDRPQRESPQGDTAEEAGVEPEVVRLVLVCPTCDEPFVPEFSRRCEWCSHQFEDGIEISTGSATVEQISSQAIAVALGLLALLLALAGYFAWIVPGS